MSHVVCSSHDIYPESRNSRINIYLQLGNQNQQGHSTCFANNEFVALITWNWENCNLMISTAVGILLLESGKENLSDVGIKIWFVRQYLTSWQHCSTPSFQNGCVLFGAQLWWSLWSELHRVPWDFQGSESASLFAHVLYRLPGTNSEFWYKHVPGNDWRASVYHQPYLSAVSRRTRDTWRWCGKLSNWLQYCWFGAECWSGKARWRVCINIMWRVW